MDYQDHPFWYKDDIDRLTFHRLGKLSFADPSSMMVEKKNDLAYKYIITIQTNGKRLINKNFNNKEDVLVMIGRWMESYPSTFVKFDKIVNYDT